MYGYYFCISVRVSPGFLECTCCHVVDVGALKVLITFLDALPLSSSQQVVPSLVPKALFIWLSFLFFVYLFRPVVLSSVFFLLISHPLRYLVLPVSVIQSYAFALFLPPFMYIASTTRPEQDVSDGIVLYSLY